MIMNRKSVLTSASVLVMGGLLQTQTIAVEATFTGASVMLSAPACGEAHLRISSDDVEINRSFESCSGITFSTVDDAGQPLADGLYYYELTMEPEEMAQDQKALRKALKKSDEATAEKIAMRLQNYAIASESGMFRIRGGVADEYNESVWEAEAQAETDAAQEAAELESPILGERSSETY